MLIETALTTAGLQADVWRSTGGRGMQLVLPFDAPVGVEGGRSRLAGLLHSIGLTVGGGGLEHKQAEILPKGGRW